MTDRIEVVPDPFSDVRVGMRVELPEGVQVSVVGPNAFALSWIHHTEEALLTASLRLAADAVERGPRR